MFFAFFPPLIGMLGRFRCVQIFFKLVVPFSGMSPDVTLWNLERSDTAVGRIKRNNVLTTGGCSQGRDAFRFFFRKVFFKRKSGCISRDVLTNQGEKNVKTFRWGQTAITKLLHGIQTGSRW